MSVERTKNMDARVFISDVIDAHNDNIDGKPAAAGYEKLVDPESEFLAATFLMYDDGTRLLVRAEDVTDAMTDEETSVNQKTIRAEEHLRMAALGFPYQRIIRWAQARLDEQSTPDV